MPFSGISFLISVSIVLVGSVLSLINPVYTTPVRSFFTKILTFNESLSAIFAFTMIGGFFIFTASTAIYIVQEAVNDTSNADYITHSYSYIGQAVEDLISSTEIVYVGH
ncbi:MAG: hypothetical protein KBD50_00335 [Candidatus Pacebacteria bacterium]|nr:hypothetical protein [Candidatus Paceibacterota bacterium]